jgi:hypothetical protein
VIGVKRMVRKHIFVDEELNTWLKCEAARQKRPYGEAVRHHLAMARKYAEAIQAAENAPVKFVRDVNGLRPR